MRNGISFFQYLLFSNPPESNNASGGFVYIELLALSAAIGFYYFSFVVFLAAYLTTLLVMKFRYARTFVQHILNIVWGVFGFLIGVEHSMLAGILLALILSVVVYNIHRADNSWM